MDDLGKVAEIADSQSPLRIGLTGDFRGHKFELTGRAQNRHELGGVWDEWYATFSNGWVGWLAEAQGKFYLTFYQPLPEGRRVPDFYNLQLGQPVQEIPSQTPFMVTEKGTATSVAADGEIPYKLTPNDKSDYADLSGAGNAFATIDYSENPARVFVGQQVTLDEIGLGNAKPAEREAARVNSAAMGCPNCGGPLTLAVPDKTERVTCPFCNSLLDVNQGNLTFLKSLKPSPSPHEFILPIGAEGTFENVKQKIIGAVVRSVTFDGVKYFWHEYLLYNPGIGFRWLVHSDNHWNYVQPVNPADVTVNEVGKPTAVFNGTTFKIFQDAGAVVEYVKGEFYWRVSQGEAVRAVDYINAPLMLSMERGANEINWSLGSYKTNKEIEETFGVANLPKPWTVAPNQPFTGGFYYTYGLIPLLLLFIVAVFMLPISGTKSTVLSQDIVLPPMTNATTAQTIFSQPFEIKGNRNVRVTANTPGVDNSWVELDADLVNEQNSDVESVPINIEYYQGSDSDGAWTEGSKEQDATLSSIPGGKYTLRLAGSWGNWQQPLPLKVKIEQNVVRGVNFCCALVVLLIIPLLAIFRKLTFESKRWSESMFSNSSS